MQSINDFAGCTAKQNKKLNPRPKTKYFDCHCCCFLCFSCSPSFSPNAHIYDGRGSVLAWWEKPAGCASMRRLRASERRCVHSIVHVTQIREKEHSIVHGIVHVTRLIENEAGYAHQSALQFSVCVRQASLAVHDIELSGKLLPGARSFFSLRL